MTKTEQVRGEMVKAMKSGDKPRKDALSLLLAALKAKYIDKRADLTEEEENTIIQRELKQTRETLESTPEDYTELLAESRLRLAVISEFAPETMSAEEIKAAIAATLATLGLTAPSIKDKGVIMKTLMPLVKGKADGALVNTLVGELFV